MPVFVKVFIFFLILMLMTTIPVFFLATGALKKFGQFSDVTNTRQIREMADTFLATMALEKAQKYDHFFSSVQASAAFVALKAQETYNHMDTVTRLSVKPPMIPNPANNLFYTPDSEPVITAFWGDTVISPRISTEIHALSGLDPFIIHAKKRTGRSLAAHIITASGIGKYYTDNPHARQRCFELPSRDAFDLRHGEPMTTFTRQVPPDYRPRWTRIYKDDVIDGLMITATAPVVDTGGRFRAIAGIDIPLNNITSDPIPDHAYRNGENRHDACCFSFFMTPAGELISFPFSLLPLFGLDVNAAEFKDSSDILSLKLTDSSIPGVRQAAARIVDNHGDPFTLDIDGRRYVLASQRLIQTGWHIVVVNSEKQLLSSVHQTRQAMKETLSEIMRYFGLCAAVIFFAALLFISVAVRHFLRPIRQLTGLTRKISRKEYDVTATAERRDEIGELSRAFNQMAGELLDVQKREKAYTESLAHSTAQLRQLNEHLVNCEEIQRKTIASDLHDSIAQTLGMGISKIKNMTESETSLRVENLSDIQSLLNQALREIRSLIYRLSPPVLDDFDIDNALGFLVEETNDKKKTAFVYNNHVTEALPLNHALKITLYRATNELLTNIIKHAGTVNAQVDLSATDTQIILQVKDQGIGMDTEKAENIQDCGFGLYSLAERIQNFGGSMKIMSSPGQGTKITITTPIIFDIDAGK